MLNPTSNIFQSRVSSCSKNFAADCNSVISIPAIVTVACCGTTGSEAIVLNSDSNKLAIDWVIGPTASSTLLIVPSIFSPLPLIDSSKITTRAGCCLNGNDKVPVPEFDLPGIQMFRACQCLPVYPAYLSSCAFRPSRSHLLRRDVRHDLQRSEWLCETYPRSARCRQSDPHAICRRQIRRSPDE